MQMAAATSKMEINQMKCLASELVNVCVCVCVCLRACVCVRVCVCVY